MKFSISGDINPNPLPKRNIEDLEGEKYSKLTVLGFSHVNKRRNSFWVCLCDCGNKVVAQGSLLKNGTSKSCGCLRQDCNFKTHGLSNHPLYSTWSDIKKRCECSTSKYYYNYGGRGIKVCPEWKNDFVQFLKDMGDRPKGFSIDRINVNGNYEPGNCRWASRETQNNNTRKNKYINYRGQLMTASQLSREIGISRRTISARIQKGYSIEAILSQSRYTNAKCA